LAGFAIAKGDVLAVMDADFSHPTDLVARLALTQQATGADIVVGSRYIPGGSIVGWPWRRKLASRVASWLARPFTAVHDPLSGCFLLRRAVIEGVPLSPTGFKILLEVLVKGRYAHIEEVPYTFHDRRLGKSKMGPAEIMRYLIHLGRLALWRFQHKRPGVEQGTFAR
jgi:dolichol-phosphate mannosyltransferase